MGKAIAQPRMGAHTHPQAVRPPPRAPMVYEEVFVPEEKAKEEEVMLSSAHSDPAPSGGDQGWLKSSWQ